VPRYHAALPEACASRFCVGSIVEGIRYAKSRPELIGTYVVDILAMIFAMPTALFPLLAEQWSGATAAGMALRIDGESAAGRHLSAVGLESRAG